MAQIEVSQYPNLITLINETYTDQVENIVNAMTTDDGDIIAVALDGNKRLAVKITDTEILIKLLNAEDIEQDSPAFQEATTVNVQTETLRRQAGPIVDQWVSQIKDTLEGSETLADFSQSLVEMYSDLDGDDLRAVMEDALTVASLAGRFEDGSEDGEIDDET